MIRIGLLHAAAAIAATMSPAHAVQELTPEPGWRYRVTGVAAHDVLNVRAQPGAESGKVGELAPQARDVVVTGTRAETDGSVWWQVAQPGAPSGSGWVNARFLTPQDAEAERERDYPLQCGGTEPFWSLEVADGAAAFTSPDGEPTTWTAGGWREARGRLEEFAVWLESAGGAGFAAVLRTYGFCSDGMSDLQYPFSILLIRPDGEVLSGCCSRGG